VYNRPEQSLAVAPGWNAIPIASIREILVTPHRTASVVARPSRPSTPSAGDPRIFDARQTDEENPVSPK
jgi:hypothetical protein